MSMGETPPILRARGLAKRYGALVVSDDVSLDLRAGEIHALIGPNGAGKTTLLHLLSGALRADGGAVEIAGRNMTHAPPQARARAGLARTFQITSIAPSLSVLDNVALAAQAHAARPLSFFRRAEGDAALDAPALAALAEVGLAERAQAPARILSHGEKRALEIAMALASDPKVVLFDEPMAGMGREESQRLVALLARLKGRCAMLLVEHDLDAVFTLADRISVLVYGKVIASGSVEAVRADPAVRAAYIGEGL
jgi:branched-chain amino acid transport system ATP-binding protein